MAKKKQENIGEEGLPYEQVVEKLEEMVSLLERGELGLDAQLQAFESGMGLLRRGQALLDKAESRVEELLADGQRGNFAMDAGLSDAGEEGDQR